MEIKFRCWLNNSKKMQEHLEYLDVLNEIIESYNKKEDVYVIMQNTGIKDRYRKDVFDGDYILYDTGKFRSFIKVSRGKIEFTFKRWDKYDDKWKRCTYQGIDTYGQIIGNTYEGIKSKRMLNEMLEQGIEI